MNEIEKTLEYQFVEPKLLNEALTHPSIDRPDNADKFNYERLEFLGDSVLSLVISEQLLYKYPNEKEGELAKRRAGLVRGETIAKVAKRLKIGEHIIMSDGERSGGGQDNESNLENVMEAIIGAMHLDGGINASKKFIIANWGALLNEMLEPPKDAKSFLQEWSQGEGGELPEYKVISRSGLSHSPMFEIEVSLKKYGNKTASSTSKKKAEQLAAQLMVEQLKKDGFI